MKMNGADAILRSAFNNPGPGQTALPHVQNVRMRYRLRFNFDTNINPWVSFHGQLATGPRGLGSSLELIRGFPVWQRIGGAHAETVPISGGASV